MKKLLENTWVEDDGGVRIFLLTGEKKGLVIDSGISGQDLHSLIRQHTDLPYTLLNTHADMDHMAGNSQFPEIYMHVSEMADYHNTQNGPGKVLPLYEGDRIDLGGRCLTVIHLPGHTPGSITLLDPDHRCLFGGDSIQEDGDIFMFGSSRDMEAYISSLERLDRREDFDFIYPSHAKEKVSRDVIPLLIAAARSILEGKMTGEKKEMFGHHVISYDAGACRFLCDANRYSD